MIITMTIRIIISFLLFPFVAMAENAGTFFIPTRDFQTTEEVLELAHTEANTDCASSVFADALNDNAGIVSEFDSESAVRAWAKETMTSADVLQRVLECNEIKSVSDDTQISFKPIVYEFPMGRTITINYSTTPSVLKQHLLLATKPSLPNGNPNPKLMDPNDPAKYLNTEPAWYAIMVVQHGALSEFVGPDKNNTLSVKYINDNIDKIYPHGYHCTSKSAWANDSDTINKVVHNVVNIEDDSNDYYVAGDVNLEWVMYAEIAADVVITALTWGGGKLINGWLKWQRARHIEQSLKATMHSDDVKRVMELTKQIDKHADDIAKIGKNIEYLEKQEYYVKEYERVRKEMNQLKSSIHKNPKKMKQYQKDQKYLDKIYEQIQRGNPEISREMVRNPVMLYEKQKKLLVEMEALKETLQTTKSTSRAVKSYEESVKALEEIIKYEKDLSAFRRKQTGNVIVQSLKKIIKPIKAANTGAKELNRAARVARAGMSSRSARMADWLMDATLKHGARLAKFESKVGGIYGVVAFLGDMWDKTSNTSKEFSNGIEFKPLCLLSADDLQGQENVVNYGMWLMWTGNSTDVADDDAAYLQAMDFATKFYYQLDEYQDEHGAQCNVDIYVVRPIIRLDETNVDDPHGEMFYLFMNEIPWSTAEQFNTQISDVNKWEAAQQTLYDTDPKQKYNRPSADNGQ